jgi:hypothetical protein
VLLGRNWTQGKEKDRSSSSALKRRRERHGDLKAGLNARLFYWGNRSHTRDIVNPFVRPPLKFTSSTSRWPSSEML